jgi:hypothetical protein
MIRARLAETLARVRVTRPPTWLVVAGWAVMGLGWLADTVVLTFLAAGAFAALVLWWGLWLGQRGRP